MIESKTQCCDSQKIKKSRFYSTRKALNLNMSLNDMVELKFPENETFSPIVIQSTVPDTNLESWVAENDVQIKEWLYKYGAILFRGFDLSNQDHFWSFLESQNEEMMHYLEATTPRVEVLNKIYTSTEYPPEQTIALHNECSAVQYWPMKLWLFCEIAALDGGESPLADVRKVLNRIPEDIKEKFRKKGWALVRNYGEGFGRPWQTAFRTNSKRDVALYCDQSEIEHEWIGNDHLRTTQVRKAIQRHPITGEDIWFNHMAFWHGSSLDPVIRNVLEHEYSPFEMPYNTFYGDLTPIDDSVVEIIRQAYDSETFSTPWQQGDLALIDNMLVAHGRNSFEGQRRVLVAMSEPSKNYPGSVGSMN